MENASRSFKFAFNTKKTQTAHYLYNDISYGGMSCRPYVTFDMATLKKEKKSLVYYKFL